MPHPGQQHASISNPFETPQRHVSEYTAQEIAVLQSRLEKQLGPEYISARAGPSGQKVHYIAAEKCIALANEVFGFNGWSSALQNIQVDFVDENPQTHKISLGLSVIVRVTLRDGTFHEDIGYGQIENCKSKAAAFEKAKKEGTTDALKRALRNFGNVLGNCIYDKSYLARVTKMKVGPTRFDEDNLHRHNEFAKKEEPVAAVPKSVGAKIDSDDSRTQSATDGLEDLLGEFDDADFYATEAGHPDEVVLPNTAQHSSVQDSSGEKPSVRPAGNPPSMQPPPRRPLARAPSGGNSTYTSPQTPNQQRPYSRGPPNTTQAQQSGNTALRPQQSRPQPPQAKPYSANTNPSGQNGGQNSSNPPPGAIETVGFFSARAVSQLPEESLITGQVAPQAGQIFNPRAESPSIRKTPGIDHTKSMPLSRSGQHVPPSSQSGTNGIGAATSASGGRAGSVGPPPGTAVRGNVVNPQLDQTRRIGAPGGGGSPLANRGQYRPPTMINKRQHAGDGPSPSVGAGADGKVPLAEVSNNTSAVPVGAGGPDLKRQKTS